MDHMDGMNMGTMTMQHGVPDLPPLDGMRMLTSWEARPVVIILLLAATLLYLYGVRQAAASGEHWSKLRTAAFLGGIATLALALLSFIGVYDMTQFWVHMVQHLMLIMVAPTLLAAGGAERLLVAATTGERQERAKRFFRNEVFQMLTSLPVLIVLYPLTIVVTHLTSIAGSVMDSAALTNVEHVVYLVVGYLFFLPVFSAWPERQEPSFVTKLLMVILTMPADAFTGVVLMNSATAMFAPRPGAPDPVTDLKWGGVTMWVGGGLIMSAMVVVVVGQWLRRPERTSAGHRGLLDQTRYDHLLGENADQTIDLDDDQAALDAYNEMLAQKARATALRRKR